MLLSTNRLERFNREVARRTDVVERECVEGADVVNDDRRLRVPDQPGDHRDPQDREPIGSPQSAEYERVSFTSSDGLKLSRWYRASRNRVAVVVVHGAGGDRTGAV